MPTATLPDPPPTMTAVSQNDQFVVPLYSSIDAEGSAEVSVVQQQTVSMAYNLKFDYTLSDAQDAADLINAWVLTQNGGTTDMTASGGFDAAMSTNAGEVAAFKAVLQKVLLDAQDSSNNTLTDVLYNQVLINFTSIFGDGVANVLQSDWNLSVTMDASGGAANMYNDLAASSDACQLIAQQIPNSNYLLYVDGSENAVSNALPLKNNDKLVFLFNVTLSTITQSVESIQKMAAFYNSIPGSGVAAADASQNVVDLSANPTAASHNAPTYTVNSQIAAFYVTVNGAGCAAIGEVALLNPSSGQIAGARFAQEVVTVGGAQGWYSGQQTVAGGQATVAGAGDAGGTNTL